MAPSDFSTKPYPAAVVFSLFSLLVIIADTIPFAWQIRNRNLGGAALIFWLGVLNFIGFINPIIWPHDDVSEWFLGSGFCDIEIRLHLAATFGLQTSLILVFKGLAEVLDTKNTTMRMNRAQTKRKIVSEALICFGTPALFILTYYIVQAGRYDILGISGCAYLLDDSWLSIVLVSMWFPILDLIAAVLASKCYLLHAVCRHNTNKLPS